MLKSIQLKLLKIKYSGDSIGDDIHIEIEVLGKFLRVDKTIKVGTTTEINREIGRFEADRGIFQTDISITVIDKDIVFNDVGNIKGDIKINTAAAKSQEFVFEVSVKETRSSSGKTWGAKTAIFEITLEAEVSDAIRYVSFEQGEGGWTNAKLKSKNIEIALPAYLQVKLEERDAKRQRFTILEGHWKNEEASLKIESNGISYLELINRQTNSIHLIYSLSKNILKFGRIVYKTKRHPEDVELPQKGLHDLGIPDSPHAAGRQYLDRAALAQVWFPVSPDKSGRYLHTGAVTQGCITLTEIKKWDKLCKTLMKARKGDGDSIGTIEIID